MKRINWTDLYKKIKNNQSHIQYISFMGWTVVALLFAYLQLFEAQRELYFQKQNTQALWKALHQQAKWDNTVAKAVNAHRKLLLKNIDKLCISNNCLKKITISSEEIGGNMIR